MTPEQWDKLLNTFGDVANATYQAAMKQVTIDFIFNLSVLITCVVIVFVLVRWLIKELKNGNNIDEPGLILAISSIITIPCFLISSNEIIGFLFNPQWQILEKLASLLT